MRLVAARVSNFRSLKDVEVEFSDFTVLVGANNVGKTSFLDALHAAIGATRRTLGRDDIRLELGELDVPKSRAAIIDVLLRPVDENGNLVDRFPMGSFWTSLWGDGVYQDLVSGYDFVAIRTKLKWDVAQGDYRLIRKFLKEWRVREDWLATEEGGGVTPRHLDPIGLHYMDAKRDIEEDLRSKGSFWRRLTDDLGLTETEISEFEEALSGLNLKIVEKSEVLRHIKENLAEIERVISAEKEAIEISPVARRLRDLSRGVDVTFSAGGSQAFPLTRHGMGTRSLASLLVFRAFAGWKQEQARRAGDLVHTLLALEEPEAHLHPQAQRALFGKLRDIPGQRIVSTHSPYFAGQAELSDLRFFMTQDRATAVTPLPLDELDGEEQRKLRREILASRGDILFCRAIIAFEGETESQALPLWATNYWQRTVHELGLSFVGVGGKENYFPFVWLAARLGIPWYIFSDGEDEAVASLQRQLGKIGVSNVRTCPTVHILPNNHNFESQLVAEGYLDVCESAIETVFGAGHLDRFIADRHNTPGKKVRGEQVIRDYESAGGRERAALDILDNYKTRFAAPIAEGVSALGDPERSLPKCVKAFFDTVSDDSRLTDLKRTT